MAHSFQFQVSRTQNLLLSRVRKFFSGFTAEINAIKSVACFLLKNIWLVKKNKTVDLRLLISGVC